MNDELTGQLTDEWEIPRYAQPVLWLENEGGGSICEGDQGLFELPMMTPVLTLRWGQTGPALTQLRWQPDNLAWDGSIRLGGMVESVHLQELAELELMMGMVAFSAQPLNPDIPAYLTAQHRRQLPYAIPQYSDGVDDSHTPMTVILLAEAESQLITTAHDAMLNRLPLYVFGRLAEDEEGWHDFFALPIIWEGVTIFAP